MQACAYVVGSLSGAGAELFELALALDLTRVARFNGLVEAEAQALETPLMFFLFAEVPQARSLKAQADAIRFSTSRHIRYCPMIYLCEAPSKDTIQRCIDMGFDDIVTLPFTAQRLGQRLARLVDSVQVYFETAAYLGPNRKAPAAAEAVHQRYRRIELVRTAANGVSVVRDQMHAGH